MIFTLIMVLTLAVMIIACLPVTQKYFYQYIKKAGYWSLLVIFIFYLLNDIWFILQVSNKTPNYWLIFVVINLAGVIALFKTYQQIKK